jgi:hypothetical protein
MDGRAGCNVGIFANQFPIIASYSISGLNVTIYSLTIELLLSIVFYQLWMQKRELG